MESPEPREPIPYTNDDVEMADETGDNTDHSATFDSRQPTQARSNMMMII